MSRGPFPSRPVIILTSEHRSDSDLGSTIFKGQIITVATIVIFLAVFLLREWIFQNMPQVQAHQAEEVPAPPRPEEWRPDMAVRWRRRRVERARELGQLPQRVAPLPLRPRQRRLPDDAQWLHPADALDARLHDGHRELRERHMERDGPHIQDEWEDMPTDVPAQLGGAVQEKNGPAEMDDRASNLYHHRAAVTFDEAEVFAERPDPARMRAARNRYFAVEDHNRDFTGQADVVARGSSSSGATLLADQAPSPLMHPTTTRPPRRSPRLNPDLEDYGTNLGEPSSSQDQHPNGTQGNGPERGQGDNHSDSSSLAGELQLPGPRIGEIREDLFLAQAGGADEMQPDDEAEEAEEGDDEIQIGPGLNDAMFDDDLGEEGGFILEGDVEGILEGR